MEEVRSQGIDDLYRILKETIESKNVDIFNDALEKKDFERKKHADRDSRSKPGILSAHDLTETDHAAHPVLVKPRARRSSIQNVNMLQDQTVANKTEPSIQRRQRERRKSYMAQMQSINVSMNLEEDATALLNNVGEQLTEILDRNGEMVDNQKKLETKLERLKQTLVECLEAPEAPEFA